MDSSASSMEDSGTEPTLDALRARITRDYRRDEAGALAPLLAEAEMPAAMLEAAQDVARRLAEGVRAERQRAGGVDALMLEFSLDSREGIALMCLAEALLRIPDAATRDLLIRDKLGRGDWHAHVGRSPSLFVNAAAWGLLVTGRLVDSRSDNALEQALASLLRKGGEPLVRKGVDLAMRLLGKQFVLGRTIEEALGNARERHARGYRFSFDMLGEAALTEDDALRYLAAYAHAIRTIGAAAAGAGVIAGHGISIKLSALHPRYVRAQRARVFAELLPRVTQLAQLAKELDIGFNIDAEEADRLDLSLDLLAALAADPSLTGWQGLGFVVQSYQKRARATVDWLAALARRHRRRLMVRLVKGAYWDAEVKRAQVDGLPDYPVFTRKVHTDVAYLACAKAMLRAPDAFYPQFASHNAYTIAAVHALAGDAQFEFQCLHGMGESVYDLVTGPGHLDRPCRIYAPVGSHETLLGVPGPAPARERRQHVVRQPDRRSRGADRRGDRGSRRASAANGRRSRIRASRARSHSFPTGRTRRVSTCPTSRSCAPSNASSPRRTGMPRHRCSRPRPNACVRARRSAIPPMPPRSSARSRTPTRTMRRWRWPAPRAKAARGRGSRRRRARTCSTGRPT